VGRIHQLLPSYAARDAIGNHAFALQAMLDRHGRAGEVFAQWRDDAPGPCRPHTDLERARLDPDDVLLYHLSTGSPVAAAGAARSERLVVDYHNVTPAALFAPWEPRIAPELALGRRQLADLAVRATLAVADSGYNAGECRSLGYARTLVAPILVDVEMLVRRPDEAVMRRLADEKQRQGGTDWLFVGRIAPNKAQHHIVAAFALYRRLYDPDARLTLVGGPSSDAYWRTLSAYIGGLRLDGTVRMVGSIDAGTLAAHYRTADVFVCLSEHEGFCVPLLEAMANEVPIVAYARTAVPETLAGAGLMLPHKDRATVAAAVHRVVGDTALADRLRGAGRARLADFALERTGATMLDALLPLVEP